jgi:hypothetical protein
LCAFSCRNHPPFPFHAVMPRFTSTSIIDFLPHVPAVLKSFPFLQQRILASLLYRLSLVPVTAPSGHPVITPMTCNISHVLPNVIWTPCPVVYQIDQSSFSLLPHITLISLCKENICR